MADAAIIFDLDDTLYKERHYVESALRALAAEVGIAAPALPHSGADVPAAASRAIDVLASAAGVPVAEIQDRYRRHTPALADSEGALAMLTSLHQRGYVTGILTDGRGHSQRAKLAALGLDRVIEPDHIFISGETGISKPDPRAWQQVADCIPATHYIYVGDNTAKDFAVPRALGWHTIGIVDDGRNIHPQNRSDRAAQPDVWAPSLAEVPAIIKSIIV